MSEDISYHVVHDEYFGSGHGGPSPDNSLPALNLYTMEGAFEHQLRKLGSGAATFCREEKRLVSLVLQVSSLSSSPRYMANLTMASRIPGTSHTGRNSMLLKFMKNEPVPARIES